MEHYGLKKSKQRFEQCIDDLENYMKQPLNALIAQRYYDKDVQEASESLVMEAVNDFIAWPQNFVTEDYIQKLKNIKLLVSFSDEVLNISKVEEQFTELDLDGSESLLELRVAFQKIYQKQVLGGVFKDILYPFELDQLKSFQYSDKENILSESFIW